MDNNEEKIQDTQEIPEVTPETTENTVKTGENQVIANVKAWAVNLWHKIKQWGIDTFNYFKTPDKEKVILWIQVAFVVIVTIVMTRVTAVSYYKSCNTSAQLAKTTFQQYCQKNRALMNSFFICAGLSWTFLTAVTAWACGKFVKYKLNIKY